MHRDKHANSHKIKETERRTDKERAKQWDGTRVRRKYHQDKTINTKNTLQEKLAKI